MVHFPTATHAILETVTGHPPDQALRSVRPGNQHRVDSMLTAAVPSASRFVACATLSREDLSSSTLFVLTVLLFTRH